MINIAVVGCGYWGPNLIRNFSALSECAMKKVCDVDKGRLEHMRGLYCDIGTINEFEDLVNDSEIDAIAIATPVRYHYEMGKKSLLAGKHTFIEKPLAASVQQARELQGIAQEKNLTLMVGHTFIYSSPVRRIKEIIETGDLGEILYVCSRRLNLGLFQKDINVAWDLATHDISILLYALNEMPVSVSCQGEAHITNGVEDVTNMSLHFPKRGLFAMIHSSWLDPNKVREMTFVGSKRMLVYNDLEPMEKIKIFDKRVERPPHYDTFAEFHYSYHYGDIYSPYIKQVEPLRVECQHFLDCINNGQSSESGAEKGVQVIQILEAASESLKNKGREIRIQELE